MPEEPPGAPKPHLARAAPAKSPSSDSTNSADRIPTFRSCRRARRNRREKKASSRWDRTALRRRSPMARRESRPGCNELCKRRAARQEWGNSAHRHSSARGCGRAFLPGADRPLERAHRGGRGGWPQIHSKPERWWTNKLRCSWFFGGARLHSLLRKSAARTSGAEAQVKIRVLSQRKPLRHPNKNSTPSFPEPFCNADEWPDCSTAPPPTDAPCESRSRPLRPPRPRASRSPPAHHPPQKLP